MELDRRHFLGLGAGTGLAALVAGLTVAPTAEELLLDIVADRFFAGDHLPTPSALQAGKRAGQYAQRLPWPARLQIRGILRWLEWRPLPKAGKRFSELSPDVQQSLLVELAQGDDPRARKAISALQRLCAMGVFCHPTSWAAIGYPGPPPTTEPGSSPAVNPQ